MQQDQQSILVLYTGGTIGSMPRDPDNPLSPLHPVDDLKRLLEALPGYDSQRECIAIHQTAVQVKLASLETPLDSASLGPDEWLRIATLLKRHWDGHAGFVVLHGTDTLAYTSSALSFMLTPINKPVVLTGSQRPMGSSRTDAVQNLATAMEFAAAPILKRPVIPEITVFFGDRLMRGNRVSKVSSNDFQAFDTPCHPPLATAGNDLKVREDAMGRPRSKRVVLRKSLQRSVVCLDVFPGMSIPLFSQILSTPGLKGAILKTFGSGTTPTDEEFMQAIENATCRGVIIVSVSQCLKSEVSLGRYESSAELLARGVVSGMDMTFEAALCKLFVVLGEESNPVRARALMQLNLAGEQRESCLSLSWAGASLQAQEHCILKLERGFLAGPVHYRPDRLEWAVLRIIGLEADAEEAEVHLDFWLDEDEPQSAEASEDHGSWLGTVRRKCSIGQGADHLFLDVTAQIQDGLDLVQESTLSIRCNSDSSLHFKRVELALYLS